MERAKGWFLEWGLVRVRQGRLLAGVCAGIAARSNQPRWLIRVAFIASCLLPGPQFLVYLALWILMPDAQEQRNPPTSWP